MTHYQGRCIIMNKIRYNGIYIQMYQMQKIEKECKKQKQKKHTQKAMDLSSETIENTPGFTNNSMGCFVSLYIKDGRKET